MGAPLLILRHMSILFLGMLDENANSRRRKSCNISGGRISSNSIHEFFTWSIPKTTMSPSHNVCGMSNKRRLQRCRGVDSSSHR